MKGCQSAMAETVAYCPSISCFPLKKEKAESSSEVTEYLREGKKMEFFPKVVRVHQSSDLTLMGRLSPQSAMDSLLE